MAKETGDPSQKTTEETKEIKITEETTPTTRDKEIEMDREITEKLRDLPRTTETSKTMATEIRPEEIIEDRIKEPIMVTKKELETLVKEILKLEILEEARTIETPITEEVVVGDSMKSSP